MLFDNDLVTEEPCLASGTGMPWRAGYLATGMYLHVPGFHLRERCRVFFYPAALVFRSYVSLALIDRCKRIAI